MALEQWQNEDHWGILKDKFNALISPPGWNDLTLETGYTPIGFGDNPQYYKDPFGWVHLRGAFRMDPSVWSLIAFTLPAGYRPLKYEYFACAQDYTSGTVGIWEVAPNGDFGLYGGNDGAMRSGPVTLSVIKFYAG